MRIFTPLLILAAVLLLIFAAEKKPLSFPKVKKDSFTILKEGVVESYQFMTQEKEPLNELICILDEIEVRKLFPPLPSVDLAGKAAPDKNFVAKGVYVNGSAAGGPLVLEIADHLKSIGGNTVVFDVREVDGAVYFHTRNPLARAVGASDKAPIRDLKGLIDALHQKGIHAVARIAVFKDEKLAKERPDLAIQNISGGPWIGGEGLSWLDPSHPVVQEYVLSLAEEVAQAGIDEIQFDYIRFPATTGLSETQFHYNRQILSKKQIITGFVIKAHDRLKPYKILLSADVFGVIAWDASINEKILGQSLPELAQYLDVISPMLYPSHFHEGYDGFASPADEPQYFIYTGVEKSLAKIPPGGAVIRPWLQAFGWKTATYGPDYLVTQVRAAQDAKGVGWLFWNAGSSYGLLWRSL